MVLSQWHLDHTIDILGTSKMSLCHHMYDFLILFLNFNPLSAIVINCVWDVRRLEHFHGIFLGGTALAKVKDKVAKLTVDDIKCLHAY